MSDKKRVVPYMVVSILIAILVFASCGVLRTCIDGKRMCTPSPDTDGTYNEACTCAIGFRWVWEKDPINKEEKTHVVP